MAQPLTLAVVFIVGFGLGLAVDQMVVHWGSTKGVAAYLLRDHTAPGDHTQGDHTTEAAWAGATALADAQASVLGALAGQPRQHGMEERELFTTTTPDAFPVGRLYTESGRYRREPHIITRVIDLGAFQDIDGQRHQHWRVYGRPA
jgi:hypothetical protein